MTIFNFGNGPVPAHRHPNGGGWVADTASVAETAYVGPDARVFENAQIFGYARVFENAWVFGNARVFGNTQIFGYAWISGYAQVFGKTQVFGNTRVCGDAKLIGGEWTTAPLQIHGTRDVLCQCSPTEVAIGCEIHSISHWLENYKAIGKKHRYSEEEIREYYDHLQYFQKRMKND